MFYSRFLNKSSSIEISLHIVQKKVQTNSKRKDKHSYANYSEPRFVAFHHLRCYPSVPSVSSSCASSSSPMFCILFCSSIISSLTYCSWSLVSSSNSIVCSWCSTLSVMSSMRASSSSTVILSMTSSVASCSDADRRWSPTMGCRHSGQVGLACSPCHTQRHHLQKAWRHPCRRTGLDSSSRHMQHTRSSSDDIVVICRQGI